MKTLDVRISDNVLEPVNHPVRRLFIEDGEVVKTQEMRSGAYSWDGGPQVGWTLANLRKWSQQDPTGSHPEVYGDLGLFQGGQFGMFRCWEDMIEEVGF